MSPVTGRQFIEDAPNTGFWFVAGQLGASEVQIGQLTGFSPRDIRASNRDIGQLLAFPYHDRRGGQPMTMDALRALHQRWLQYIPADAQRGAITLNHFRQLIDPFMEHDHG